MIHKSAQTVIETEWGEFAFLVYQEDSGKEHIVLFKKGDSGLPYVRIHSECATGDLFASTYCDCGPQLHSALEMIQGHWGAVIYLKQEGRGLGLTNKIKSYELQRQGRDTVQANQDLGLGSDERSYELAECILRDLNLNSFQLLTNNPSKIQALVDAGFSVQQVSHQMKMTSERGKKYLRTKIEKLGHLITDNE